MITYSFAINLLYDNTVSQKNQPLFQKTNHFVERFFHSHDKLQRTFHRGYATIRKTDKNEE